MGGLNSLWIPNIQKKVTGTELSIIFLNPELQLNSHMFPKTIKFLTKFSCNEIYQNSRGVII